MTKILREGRDYLERLLTPSDPAYRCVAFRAGGYCIQPERKLARSLRDTGLVIDSSVCCGFSHIGDGMYYDYKQFRAPFNCYFSADVDLEAQSATRTADSVYEIPVGGFGSFPQRVFASRMNAPAPRGKARGRGMSLQSASERRTLLRRICGSVKAVNMLTYDSYNAKAMTYMIRSLAKHAEGEVYFATIAHPKLMQEAQIAEMQASLLALKEHDRIRFVTMTQSAERLGLLSDGRSEV